MRPGKPRIVFSTAARPVNASRESCEPPVLAASALLDASPAKLTTSGDEPFECRRATPPCVPETELRIPKATCFRHKIYAAFVMCGTPAFVWRFSLRGAYSPFPFPLSRNARKGKETEERPPAALATSKRVITCPNFGFGSKAFGRSDFLLGHVVTSTRLLDQRVSI